MTTNNINKHYESHIKAMKPKIRKIRTNKPGHIVWNKGLTKDTDERVTGYGQTIKYNLDSGKIPKTYRKFTEEQKLNHSIIMRQTAIDNPKSYSGGYNRGNCKPAFYKNIKFDSSWEVIVAKWLDDNNISWTRDIKPIPYEWNGIRSYYPDFYLTELNYFIEVKGFETDRDKAKWLSVSNILIIKQDMIDKIQSNNTTFEEWWARQDLNLQS